MNVPADGCPRKRSFINGRYKENFQLTDCKNWQRLTFWNGNYKMKTNNKKEEMKKTKNKSIRRRREVQEKQKLWSRIKANKTVSKITASDQYVRLRSSSSHSKYLWAAWSFPKVLLSWSSRQELCSWSAVFSLSFRLPIGVSNLKCDWYSSSLVVRSLQQCGRFPFINNYSNEAVALSNKQEIWAARKLVTLRQTVPKAVA